jgi:hypothetical protein
MRETKKGWRGVRAFNVMKANGLCLRGANAGLIFEWRYMQNPAHRWNQNVSYVIEITGVECDSDHNRDAKDGYEVPYN